MTQDTHRPEARTAPAPLIFKAAPGGVIWPGWRGNLTASAGVARMVPVQNEHPRGNQDDFRAWTYTCQDLDAWNVHEVLARSGFTLHVAPDMRSDDEPGSEGDMLMLRAEHEDGTSLWGHVTSQISGGDGNYSTLSLGGYSAASSSMAGSTELSLYEEHQQSCDEQEDDQPASALLQGAHTCDPDAPGGPVVTHYQRGFLKTISPLTATTFEALVQVARSGAWLADGRPVLLPWALPKTGETARWDRETLARKHREQERE